MPSNAPLVADDEDLFRVIVPHWMHGGVVSSQAYAWDYFSVDIVSRTTGPAESLARVPGACAVVRFNSGCARPHGLDARDERDPAYPMNMAHAHVYIDTHNNQRKKRVRQFMDDCKPQVVLNNCG